MCGICGICRRGGERVDPAVLTAMRDRMRHRGPDDDGIFLDDGIGLGFRRLSIIDLSTGRQPLTNEDGSVVVVFNGEIYNYQELRAGLLERGHVFRTRTDTEVIVHLYEEHGDDFPARLNGMFAIAVWDRSRSRLVLARDRSGEKPLYYRQRGTELLFASEMKAFLEVPGLALELEEKLVPEIIAFGNVFGPLTLLKGVLELPPGSILTAGRSELCVREYWNVRYAPDPALSEEEATGRLSELLAESVSMRLMSDVPLGAFLSGGIDSSTIVALMARQLKEPVKTFSVGFDLPGYSELEYARQVSRVLGTEHHELTVSREEFFDALPRMIYAQDEPITHSSAIPLHFLARRAKSLGVTVLMSGEGADELFAGYGSYLALLRDLRLRRLLPGAGWKAASALLRLLGARRYANVCERYGESVEDLIWGTQSSATASECRRLAGAGAPGESFLVSQLEGTTPLSRLLHAHLKTRLVSLLMKQDKMTMAASLEVRVPFLDHRIIELAARMGDHLKIRDGRGKHVLRIIASRLVPAEIVNRRKAGFPVPIARWFREGDASLDILFQPRTMERGLVDPAAVRTLVADHRAGRLDASEAIWNLVNLEHWIRLFVEGEAVEQAERGWAPVQRAV